MIPSADDDELHDWLRWAEENGSSLLRMTAESVRQTSVIYSKLGSAFAPGEKSGRMLENRFKVVKVDVDLLTPMTFGQENIPLGFDSIVLRRCDIP